MTRDKSDTSSGIAYKPQSEEPAAEAGEKLPISDIPPLCMLCNMAETKCACVECGPVKV